MTSPTPSLPAAIREALDAYELACYRHQARQVLETFTEATGARRALEAHLLALCEDAAALDRMTSHDYVEVSSGGGEVAHVWRRQDAYRPGRSLRDMLAKIPAPHPTRGHRSTTHPTRGLNHAESIPEDDLRHARRRGR